MKDGFIVALYTVLMTVFCMAGLLFFCASGSFIYADNNIKHATLTPEQEITSFKELYVKTGDSFVSDGQYKESCLIYQKLLDILFKKSVDSNFDVWMSAYGNLYKQVDLKLKRARKLFESKRKGTLEEIFARKLKERKSFSSSIPKIKKRMALKQKGDLSLDGTLILSVFNTGSPPINSNHIIGVYVADTGEKLFDDTPIPDDRSNPQINRWGRIYKMLDPCWSPDGSKYAYSINGAVCVNDDGSGKPVLISHIPDKEDVNDVSFGWSTDSRKLYYIRTEGANRTVYWNSYRGDKEQKIMAGEKACFSSNSCRIAIVNKSRIFIYNLTTGKSEQICPGEDVIFSPDDKSIFVLRKVKGTGIMSAHFRDLATGKERELFDTSHSVFGNYSQKIIKETQFLSGDLIAFSLGYQKNEKKLSDIWIISVSKGTISPLTSDGTSILSKWLSTQTVIASQKELLYLSD